MLIKQISISHPTERTIDLVPTRGFDPLYREIYGKMNLTLLVGPNGSGKTSAMSLIARAFHYLERDRDRILGKFRIAYEQLHLDTRKDIVIQGDESCATISIDGEAPRIIAPWSKALKHSNPRREGEVSYDDIKDLLPTNIVVSAFSTRGEYPNIRADNYIGDRRLAQFDIGMMYGSNHYSMGSLSWGIARLAEMLFRGDPRVATLVDLLGIEFTGRVLVRVKDRVAWDGSPVWGRESWAVIDDGLLQQVVAGEAYFNDLELRRHSRILMLRNMSSGEKVLFVRIVSLLSSVRDRSIVLIEEPELHLDPLWAKQWITLLSSFFRDISAHFIIATHSPLFINTVFQENIVVFDENGSRWPDFNTFLASQSELEERLYSVFGSPNLPEDFVRGVIESGDPIRMAELFRRLGESHTRFQVFSQMRQVKSDVEGP